MLFPLSALEAVNIMLSVLGQAPVNSLVGSLPPDAITAKRTLDEVTRFVQARAWRFNTEQNVTLNPDGLTGTITVPQNCIRVISKDCNVDVILQGQTLYDRLKRTTQFQNAIIVDLIYYRDFDSLPETCKQYVTIRAARIMQDRVLGADSIHTYTQADEKTAWENFSATEGIDERLNMLKSRTTFNVLGRRPYESGFGYYS